MGREEKLNLKKLLPKKEKRQPTLKELREIKEWENILNYDGTKESQEEI